MNACDKLIKSQAWYLVSSIIVIHFSVFLGGFPIGADDTTVRINIQMAGSQFEPITSVNEAALFLFYLCFLSAPRPFLILI